jgi:hypothetical protein
VNREVLELIANTASDANKPVIIAHGSITADRAGFGLVLTIRDAEGTHERRLEAPACEELSHAAALIVALAINPALLATHSDPGGQAQNANVAQPSNPPPNPSPANEGAPVAAPDARLRAAPSLSAPLTTKSVQVTPRAGATDVVAWRFGLSEFVALGTLPGTNLGTALFGALQLNPWRIEAAVSQLRAEADATKPSAGAAFALYRVAARGCWLAAQAAWRLGPCAGAELGLAHGRGYGVDVSQTQNGLWAAAIFGALFELRIASSSFFGLTADAEVPSGDKFTLDYATIWEPRTSRISARIGLSLAAGW